MVAEEEKFNAFWRIAPSPPLSSKMKKISGKTFLLSTERREWRIPQDPFLGECLHALKVLDPSIGWGVKWAQCSSMVLWDTYATYLPTYLLRLVVPCIPKSTAIIITQFWGPPGTTMTIVEKTNIYGAPCMHLPNLARLCAQLFV